MERCSQKVEELLIQSPPLMLLSSDHKEAHNTISVCLCIAWVGLRNDGVPGYGNGGLVCGEAGGNGKGKWKC
jgi:hypothetical protein